MRLCPICAGDIPPVAHRCPRCGTPVVGWADVDPAARPGTDTAGPVGTGPVGTGTVGGGPVGGGPVVAGWSPTPVTAPPPPEAGEVIAAYPVPAATDTEQQPTVRSDWPGALRVAFLAMLGAYVLAAGLAVLLAPGDSPPLALWVSAPAALLGVALGGHWQATIPELDQGLPGSTFGYQVHAFPLLLSGLLIAVLARAVRSRFETGRANDTLRDRVVQALRVSVALGGFGLLTGSLSRYAVGGSGMVAHSGYIAAPMGGLLIGLLVGLAVAVSYDVTQLPAGLRSTWTALREPARVAWLFLLVTTAAGTLAALIALDATPASDLVVSPDDRRVLSGLAIASAPNVGWWFLAACLGVPVRVDLLSGERGSGISAAVGGSPWWILGVLSAVALLLAAAVRLLAGVTDGAEARRRLGLWIALVTAIGLGFVLVGTLRVTGGVGLFPVEYTVGSASPLAVLLPPVWAAVTGLGGYAITRALPHLATPSPAPDG
jgi:hypothetical protein